jgi:octaprenyl-diphosphate synthase
MGKTLGTDLAKGKVTLPVIRLYTGTPPAERLALRDRLAHPDGAADLQWLRELLRGAGAVEYAQDRARRSVDEAKAALEGLPEGFDRAPLRHLADYVLYRRA